jgi:cytochrome c556
MLAMIESKDIKGVQGQIPKMNAACAACHKAHKK